MIYFTIYTKFYFKKCISIYEGDYCRANCVHIESKKLDLQCSFQFPTARLSARLYSLSYHMIRRIRSRPDETLFLPQVQCRDISDAPSRER